MNDLPKKSIGKDTKYLSPPNDGVLASRQKNQMGKILSTFLLQMMEFWLVTKHQCELIPTTCLYAMPRLLKMLSHVAYVADIHHKK
jgi:hypothetical protein